MKTAIFSRPSKQVVLTALVFLFSIVAFAQPKRTQASLGRSEYIEVEPNVRLHVTDLGEGKPVVLIHGWPLSDAMYEYQYTALVENGFRVIGITLRGFGQSDKPYGKYNYDVFADDIKTVLDKLNINNATLGGFSMGGAVVTHYVARHQAAHVSKLLLIAAAGPKYVKSNDYPYGFPKEGIDGLIQQSKVNRPQVLENFGKIFGASETSIPAGLGSWLYNINMEASGYASTQSLIALRDADLRSALASIHIPTAIFHGKKDQLCPYDFALQLKAGIKDSFIVDFENSGHALFMEELEKFNAELIKFVK